MLTASTEAPPEIASKKVLLRFFVVENPTNKQNTDYENNQRNGDTDWRPHFFDQLENHSHVLIPFLLA
jgi:hypothetical protein